jgi:hypothetical protein
MAMRNADGSPPCSAESKREREKERVRGWGGGREGDRERDLLCRLIRRHVCLHDLLREFDRKLALVLHILYIYIYYIY